MYGINTLCRFSEQAVITHETTEYSYFTHQAIQPRQFCADQEQQLSFIYRSVKYGSLLHKNMFRCKKAFCLQK